MPLKSNQFNTVTGEIISFLEGRPVRAAGYQSRRPGGELGFAGHNPLDRVEPQQCDAKAIGRRAHLARVLAVAGHRRAGLRRWTFDRDRQEVMARVVPELEAQGVHLIGRYGAWTYSYMERALLDGAELAKRLVGETEAVAD